MKLKKRTMFLLEKAPQAAKQRKERNMPMMTGRSWIGSEETEKSALCKDSGTL